MSRSTENTSVYKAMYVRIVGYNAFRSGLFRDTIVMIKYLRHQVQ